MPGACWSSRPAAWSSSGRTSCARSSALEFEIFSREEQTSRPSGNYFEEHDLLIARLDQLVAQRGLQEKLDATEWDLIVVDEAHKLSASYFGNKVNKTKRFLLGELLGAHRPPLPADDGHPAQRQGRGLPDLALAAGCRPLLRQVPRRRPQGRRLRHDAPHGQGGAAQVRRHAAVPRAPRLHRQLRAVRPGSGPLRGRHRLRAQRDEPGRRAGRQAPRHRGLRPHPAAAPPRLQPRGHLPVPQAPAQERWRPASRRRRSSSTATRWPRPWPTTTSRIVPEDIDEA